MKVTFPQREELNFEATTSRGPGGQNVNRVASAAQLSWDFSLSFSLSAAQKQRIAERLGHLLFATFATRCRGSML